MHEKYAQIINQVREKKPLVHQITNYVTANDCANVTLAIGASPIMADSVEEASDIVSISSSLVLNIGTLNRNIMEAMITAGKSANLKGIPVILDPVGAGASKLRNDTVRKLIDEVKISVIRGNISEIRYISGLSASTKGVDASESDSNSDAGAVAAQLAAKLGCVVAITGKVDVVSDGNRQVHIENGHELLASVTGTGCMCSSLVGSFCGAAPENPFESSVAALISMGIAGEIAHKNAGDLGTGSFRTAVIDAISKMDAETISGRAKLYEN